MWDIAHFDESSPRGQVRASPRLSRTVAVTLTAPSSLCGWVLLCVPRVLVMLIEPLAALFGTYLGVSDLVAVGISSFALAVLVSWISNIATSHFVPSYRLLTPKDQHRWNAGVTRATLGLGLAVRGLYVLCFMGIPGGDIVYGANDYIRRTCAFALGFFLFDTLDCLDMYFTFEVVEETLFVHHILGIILYVFSLTTQSYMFLTSIVLVQEFTAAPTHLGWMLTKCNMDNHILWDINQRFLILVWILCRNFMDGILLSYILYFIQDFVFYGPMLPSWFILGGVCLLAFVLNPWWLKLKVRQIRKRDMKYRDV